MVPWSHLGIWKAATLATILPTQLAPGDLDFRTPAIPKLIKVSTIPTFVQTTWFMLNICFSSGSLEFWSMLSEGAYVTSPRVRPMGAGSLTIFHGSEHFTYVATTHWWGHEAHPAWLHWARAPRSGAYFPPDSAPGTFSLCWCSFASLHSVSPSTSPPMSWVLWALHMSHQTRGES